MTAIKSYRNSCINSLSFKPLHSSTFNGLPRGSVTFAFMWKQYPCQFYQYLYATTTIAHVYLFLLRPLCHYVTVSLTYSIFFLLCLQFTYVIWCMGVLQWQLATQVKLNFYKALIRFKKSNTDINVDIDINIFEE